MKSATSVIIELPEARRLIELTSIDHDLRACLDNCQLWIGLQLLPRDQPNHHQLTEAVASAIFIKYARSVKGGIRDKTQLELLAQLDPEDKKVHDVCIAIRDKNVAHSVNSFERHDVTVWLATGDQDKGVTNVSVGTAFLSPAVPDVVTNMMILVKRMREWVLGEQKKESQRLLELVRQRFTLDELYALIGKVIPHQVTYGEIAKRRSI